MTLNKATVLTAVKARTGRGDLTDIDTELKAILIDISTWIPAACQTSSAVTIAAAGTSAALPATCTTPLGVQGKDKIKFPEYLAYAAASSSGGVIKRIAFFGNRVYVHPPPASETVLTLFHGEREYDPDNIGLDDDFLEALIEGTTAKVWAGLGVDGQIPPQAATHKNLYEEQIALMIERYRFQAT